MTAAFANLLTRNKTSLSTAFRLKRFQLFKAVLDTLPLPATVLDVGGTASIWEYGGYEDSADVSITIMNLENSQIRATNMISLVGDARSMPQFQNQQFDIVFSNSVIEHVGDFADQKQMAMEVVRVGKNYIVQTPNYFFPFEPHFLFPCFQFLPFWLKLWLTRNFNLGHRPKAADQEQAIVNINSIRLLTRKEMAELFPDAIIYEEKFFGLTKSFAAIGGTAATIWLK